MVCSSSFFFLYDLKGKSIKIILQRCVNELTVYKDIIYENNNIKVVSHIISTWPSDSTSRYISKRNTASILVWNQINLGSDSSFLPLNVILGKLRDFPKLQIPHLWNGNNTYIIEFVWGLSEIMFKKHWAQRGAQ